jgi:hypothetical protein
MSVLKPLVFVAQPTYNQYPHQMATQAVRYATLGLCNTDFRDDKGHGSPCSISGSVLTDTFNQLWVEALNLRAKYRITHFAMLHSDIHADPGWLDILVSEQRRLGADVVSAVVPLKNSTGLTSTGVGVLDSPRGQAGIRGDSRRFTMKEVFNFPETFCAGDTDEPGKVLLPNTGCWVCDFTKPWVDAKDSRGVRRFHFATYNDITEDTEGQCHAECRSEDWAMGYMLHDLGCKVYATRKVRVVHHGDFGFTNWMPWGDWETDKSYQLIQDVRAQKAKPECSVEHSGPVT